MNNHTILIVDDEENVSGLLSKILSKKGYTALTADNGINAINIIESRRVDIVITDIKMPGMSGIELLRKVKSTDPLIKVIIITAFATLETAIEALKIGANDYIIKPFDIEEIINSVKRLEADMEEYTLFNGEFRELNDSVDSFLTSKSSTMNKTIELIKKVADTRSTIMLYGETGTGKELAAMALHTISSRRDRSFIKVNCAAIPEQLLESELFGYEKGAFTGAVAKKPGKFELANEGTIFLDEIGDISPAMQVKLLRVLQEREFEHLGGTKTIKVDVRVISATNRNIEELVKKGIIREDLYYRLNVVPVILPPLRERKEDIPDLIRQFLNKSSQITGKASKHISRETFKILTRYNWPGNIRELENVIERCVVVTPGESIAPEDLPLNILDFDDSHGTGILPARLDNAIDGAEKDAIINAIQKCHGNRTRASELLGISRRSLHRKINKYDITD